MLIRKFRNSVSNKSSDTEHQEMFRKDHNLPCEASREGSGSTEQGTSEEAAVSLSSLKCSDIIMEQLQTGSSQYATVGLPFARQDTVVLRSGGLVRVPAGCWHRRGTDAVSNSHRLLACKVEIIIDTFRKNTELLLHIQEEEHRATLAQC